MSKFHFTYAPKSPQAQYQKTLEKMTPSEMELVYDGLLKARGALAQRINEILYATKESKAWKDRQIEELGRKDREVRWMINVALEYVPVEYLKTLANQ